MSSQPERVEVLRMEDSMKAAVDILAPQLGSDGAKLAEMLIDPRRMTRLNKLEIVSLSYFLDHENDWVRSFMNNYMNLKMSEEGHERAVLLVEALKAVGGYEAPTLKKEDQRGWVQRNMTKRNKGPEKTA